MIVYPISRGCFVNFGAIEFHPHEEDNLLDVLPTLPFHAFWKCSHRGHAVSPVLGDPDHIRTCSKPK